MKEQSPEFSPTSRRRFLSTIGAAAAGFALAPRSVLAATAERRLSFVHTHTSERLSVAYADALGHLPQALRRVDWLLRDFRTGAVHAIDPALLDLLHKLALETGSEAPYHVISGYRSPVTNARLRRRGGGGVATHSLHMDGKAIDIRVPGVALADLRDAAKSLRLGGVGFYPSSNFVHVDTGRVRYW